MRESKRPPGARRTNWASYNASLLRAIEVTDNTRGDAAMLSELLTPIPEDEPIGSVGVTGAYHAKACHAAVASRNAQAIFPSRKNARAWMSSQPGAACDMSAASVAVSP